MPSVNEGESQADFVKRCVPILIGEGRPQDQAVAVCYSMYRQQAEGARKAKVHYSQKNRGPE